MATCLVMAACGDDPKDLVIPAGVEPVTGAERLGWDQQASSSQELATFRYLVYVDNGAATDIQGVSCAGIAGPAGFPCTGRLPSMTAGQHALEISTYIDSGGSRLESARSASLNVFMLSLTAPLSLTSSSIPIRFTTADGVQLHAQVAADGLHEPTDLGFVPDGGIFIAERAGRVLVFRAGRLLPAPALLLRDVVTSVSQGLLAIAVDPQFDRTRFIYLVYTTEAGFRLSRFRAVGDTLGDRAILLDGIPFSPGRPAATLRFGPDGRLYLGLDDAGESRRAGDLGSFNGKILRLNPNATTPSDQAGGSPVYTPNVSAPRGADWDATGATLWLADGGADGLGQLQVIATAGDGDRLGRLGRTIARYTMPDNAVASGLTFYRGNLFPELRGNLLVAADGEIGEAGILRLLFDPADPVRVARSERLLRGSIDGARAIAVSADGVIYLGTRHALVTIGRPPSQ